MGSAHFASFSSFHCPSSCPLILVFAAEVVVEQDAVLPSSDIAYML